MAKRILVVDDHPPTRQLIRSILEPRRRDVRRRRGRQRYGVPAGRRQEGSLRLVLLDIRLPDMDGFEVCRALRHVDKQVPIVFVTAQGELGDFKKGRDAGGDSYLVKPIAVSPCAPW